MFENNEEGKKKIKAALQKMIEMSMLGESHQKPNDKFRSEADDLFRQIDSVLKDKNPPTIVVYMACAKFVEVALKRAASDIRSASVYAKTDSDKLQQKAVEASADAALASFYSMNAFFNVSLDYTEASARFEMDGVIESMLGKKKGDGPLGGTGPYSFNPSVN